MNERQIKRRLKKVTKYREKLHQRFENGERELQGLVDFADGAHTALKLVLEDDA